VLFYINDTQFFLHESLGSLCQNETQSHHSKGKLVFQRILILKLFMFQYYRICSRNLSTLFSVLAAEKSGCVKYEDFFVVEVFYSSIIENTVRFVKILL
jgi:hypothetical protein